jgi:hypothetical protein
MHFLKCNICGHLNEVKTEYLIFCSGCNKKLGNNFSIWQKNNPEKTFDDFKKLICVSEEEISIDINKAKSHKPKGLKYWIGFVVSFAIFYAIGQFGGDSIVKFFKSEKTSKEVLNQKWDKETYGDYGLTVETPVKLTKGDLPMPENIKQYIDKMDVYNYMSSKGFKVLINSIKYKPTVGTLNLQGAANGSVNEMKMQKGVTDFVYTENYIYKDEIPGFIQKGTFKADDVDVEFINTGFASGLIVWQVCVIFQKDDEIGRIASKRVIESIEIKKKNNAL